MVITPFYFRLQTSAYTLLQPFNGLFSRTTWVSRYQKVKPVWILLEQETVSSSGISWAIFKSARRSRQITTPTPHHSVFYRPDALPATEPTASKHCRHPHISHKIKQMLQLTFYSILRLFYFISASLDY